MRYFRFLCALILSMGLTAASAQAADRHHADHDHHHDHHHGHDHGRDCGSCDNSLDRDLNERDFYILREFVNSKRVYDVQQKACALTISGDVRAEWRYMSEFQENAETKNTCALRGHNGCCKGHNDLDVECNLRFDYVNDCAWAVAHIQFDDSAGVSKGLDCHEDPDGYHGSGTDCRLNLKKAYMGYNICSNCDTRFDVEIGRRPLYAVFDSQIQFLSRADGITLKYSSTWDSIADWYCNLMGFVVNENYNHFAWATEFALLNVLDSGFDVKYSFIDWRKHGSAACKVRDPVGFRFKNSQVSIAYNVCPDYLPEGWQKPLRFYGAFVVNHNAPRWFNTGRVVEKDKEDKDKTIAVIKRGRKMNVGWYAGVTYGRVLKENDFSIDVQYQYVQAQAIPERDMSGIGRGNCLEDSFTQEHFVHGTKRVRGSGNFKGFRIESFYAITDNISLDTIIEWSTAIDKNIGGRHRYSKFELEAVYAF